MPIAPEHAFEEKSTKLLILLPLRTIYNRTFQCETPCTVRKSCSSDREKLLKFEAEGREFAKSFLTVGQNNFGYKIP